MKYWKHEQEGEEDPTIGGEWERLPDSLTGGCRSAADALRQWSSASEQALLVGKWHYRHAAVCAKIAMLDLAKFCFTMASSGF